MYLPKRQYDLAPEGVPSAPSVASLMATQGTIATDATPTVEAATHSETSEPAATASEVAPAETATATSDATPAGSEAPPAQETVSEAPPAATEQAPAQLPSWQDLIKTQPREQVLSELGVETEALTLAQTLKENPQMKAFLQHWQQKGDVKEYLQDLTTDYKQMPAEDVMRRQLREAHPRADERTLELLYKRDVVNKYNLDPDRFSEEEIEEGRLLLEADVDPLRQKFHELQQQRLIPPPVEKPAEEPPVDNSAQEVEAYKRAVTADPLFQSLSQSKVFTLGEGDDKFSFPVDPDVVSGVLFDTDKWAERMFTKQGDKVVPNTRQQLLVAMVTAYGEDYLKALGQHYRALGGKTVLDPVENASVPSAATPSQAPVVPDNPAAALAKMGRASY